MQKIIVHISHDMKHLKMKKLHFDEMLLVFASFTVELKGSLHPGNVLALLFVHLRVCAKFENNLQPVSYTVLTCLSLQTWSIKGALSNNINNMFYYN